MVLGSNVDTVIDGCYMYVSSGHLAQSSTRSSAVNSPRRFVMSLIGNGASILVSSFIELSVDEVSRIRPNTHNNATAPT